VSAKRRKRLQPFPVERHLKLLRNSPLRRHLLVIMIALSSGCAGSNDERSARFEARNQALADFIAVGELQEVDAIRTREQLNHRALSEKHIIVYDRKSSYLMIFRRTCEDRHDPEVVPDIRYDKNIIRAKFDTYKGCRIDTIYRISQGQVDELMSLGDAPGQ
jgi:hypothetical protein